MCLAEDGSVDTVGLDVTAAVVFAVVGSIVVVDLAVAISVCIVVAASAPFVVVDDVSVAPSVVALLLGDWGFLP